MVFKRHFVVLSRSENRILAFFNTYADAEEYMKNYESRHLYRHLYDVVEIYEKVRNGPTELPRT